MKDVDFKRAGLIVMMIFFVAATTIAQENPAVRQSRQLINNDQPKKGLSVITEAVKANPADASLLYYLGRVQIANGDNANAEISFQKGIDLNPKEALNIAGKGHLRMIDNNPTEAKQLFEQALSMTKSKNPAVLRAVGDGYLANEKFVNDAVAVLLKAKSNNDSDPYTFILLGDAYAKLGKGGDAVSSYEKAASMDPKSGFPYYKMGVVYFRSKNTAVAEETLLKAVSIDPNTTLAHKELGEFYYSEKKAAQAVKSYESYLALTETPEPAKLRMAFFYFMAKDYAKANAIFKELIQKPDASATVYKYAAYAAVESGNLTDAHTLFDQYFTKAAPTEITASDYVYFGKMLQKDGKDSLALVNFKKSLELEKNGDIAVTIAETYFDKMKNYAEAAKAYEEVKTIKTKLSSKEWFNLGRAYYITKQLVKADSAFAELTLLQPTITLPYAWRGRVNAAIDSTFTKALAKPYFDKVVEIGTAAPDKSKNDLIQAYEYLGYYYDSKEDYPAAKSTFEKLKAIDPANEKAVAYLQAIKQAQQQKKKPGGK
jgi:tetratricopeptide (TPR) repeat protein